jgi:hypothetical protein
VGSQSGGVRSRVVVNALNLDLTLIALAAMAL